MWVDSLCINQTDDVEKTHQVKLMAKIYRKTVLGLLWLGSTSESSEADDSDNIDDIDSELLCSQLRWYLRCFVKYSYHDRYEECETAIKYSEALNAIRLLRKMAEAGEDDHFSDGRDPYEAGAIRVTLAERVALSDLLYLKWWGRMWTIQEAVLPQRAIVFCGQLQLESRLDAFRRLMKEVYRQDLRWDDERGSDNLRECMGAVNRSTLPGTFVYVTTKGLMGIGKEDRQKEMTIHVLFGGICLLSSPVTTRGRGAATSFSGLVISLASCTRKPSGASGG